MKKVIKIRGYDKLKIEKLPGWSLDNDFEQSEDKNILDLIDEGNEVAVSLRLGAKALTISVFKSKEDNTFDELIFEKKIKYDIRKKD